MVRLFACDLDGTLFNILHTTDPFILYAVGRALKTNHYFSIATGRNMHKTQIHKYFHNLPVFCVCMNGARIITDQDEIIYEKWIGKEWIQEMLEQFPDIPFEFNSRNCTYVCMSRKEYKKYAYQPKWYIKFMRFFLDLRNVESYVLNAKEKDILEDDIFKINFSIPNQETKTRFDEYLSKRKEQIVNAPFMGTGFYELTESSVNKGTALQILCDYLQINYNQVHVYGDGMNDITMLKNFKNSFVPDNGCEKAKKAGQQIIGKNILYSVPRHILKCIR